MMKKSIIIVLLTCVIAFQGIIHGEENSGDELLISTLTGKNWDRLPTLFQDASFKILKKYFSEARAIKVVTSEENRLTYNAKFSSRGEIGVIIFEKIEDKYLNVKIKNQIKPLYFIDKFKKYPVSNLQLFIGDARIHFSSGYFYHSLPFHWLLIFEGRWSISIKPGDEEEKLTLKRKFKKDFFAESSNSGVFILHNTDFLARLQPEGEVTAAGKGSQAIYNMYREAYGINVTQFDEYWYLPFPRETNLMMFAKDKKSYYYYTYNESMVPDTQLTVSGTNDMLLSYNAHRGLKLSFGETVNVSRLNLNVYFNPKDNVISGTTSISYKNSAAVRELNLKEGIDIVGNLTQGSKGLNIFRKKNRYYLMGAENKTLALYFKGRIEPTEENLELFKSRQEVVRDLEEDQEDAFYFLSKTQHFYPNPGEEFFAADTTVNLPAGLNCLASGSLVKNITGTGDTVSYKFSSPGTKGISLVTGNFKLTKKLDSRIPLHIHTFESFRYPKRLKLDEVKEAFDFFIDRFGALNLSAVNVLLKRGRVEGGVSNTGFIAVHLPPDRVQTAASKIRSLDAAIDKTILSPILIRNRTEDHIIHELAHQWWGGIISWKSYRDVWLTEGLAHFSVLYYLKQKLSQREFNRIIKKLKRWVYRFDEAGPIIYGTRINLLEDKYEAYQSVIYNKSALVFLMLMDMIGEKEFTRRLRSIVKKYKYKSISSRQFIRQFSGKDKLIKKFFDSWIFSRAIPVVELSLVEGHKDMDTKDFKTVIIRAKQLNTDFVFPLKLKVTSRGKTSIERVVMKAKEQDFVIKRDAVIREVTIYEPCYLVKEKKQPRHAARGT